MNRAPLSQSCISDIRQFITAHKLITPGSTIIVGLSGGPDSVFLLHVLAALSQEYSCKLIAAHLDHGWREESYRDVDFCKNIAESLSIPYVSGHADQFSSIVKKNGSQEEIGRKLRRHFFETVAQQHAASHIALAHHAQDQQETFFLRLLRGASITGLTAMRPAHGLYIRPLLVTSKETILSWLHAHNIAYLTDSTNESNAFLRNRIRNTLIPSFITCDQRFSESFNRTLKSLQETEEFLDQQTNSVWNTMQKDDTQNAIDLAIFRTLHTIMQKRIILKWLCIMKVPFVPSQSFFEEIITFLCHPHGGSHSIAQSWSIVKRRNQAYILRR